MQYDIHNPFRSPRIIYVGEAGADQITILPGETARGKVLRDTEVTQHRAAGLTVSEYEAWNDPTTFTADPSTIERPSVLIDGMYGIGDNIHQRAGLREMMKTKEVWLLTPHWLMYHDLIAEGLHPIFKDTKLRAQAKTIARERHLFTAPPPIPGAAWRTKLWYKKPQIDIHGSILGTMMAELGFDGVRGDFSLPIPAHWRAKAEALKASWDTGGKPLMIYRPIVRRREWNGESRNPDPGAYAALYEAARAGFFTISIADLEPEQEWIVGGEQPANVKLHHGELDFPTMAALFSIADMGFFNAGFGPVLAQAVGLPSVVVYGGRESFRTTETAGEWLAPTLGIDPINPCDCHTERHNCDKRIDVPVALERVKRFVGETKRLPSVVTESLANAAPSSLGPVKVGEENPRGNTLIFATVFVDSGARQNLTQQWLELTSALNPGVPLLLVDSKSPLPLVSEPWRLLHPEIQYRIFNFGDNIGHLSRNHGRDGWGRAFCKGLQTAIDEGYTYVAHIEGDSLLRLPVASLIGQMVAAKKRIATTPVAGLVRDMPGWIETGLMCFETAYLKQSRFIEKYDWPHREARPTPEIIVANIVRADMYVLPIQAVRGDKQQVTYENVLSLGLDWLTHCHTDVWATDRFFEAALPNRWDGKILDLADGLKPPENIPTREADGPATAAAEIGLVGNAGQAGVAHGLMLNLGCGTNKLQGWLNHDADVDITKPLPWPEGSAHYVFIEHCVEHVSYHQAIAFFEEAYRVLAPGGVLRVVVPSIEQIAKLADQSYFAFTEQWGGEPTLKGALRAIIHAHGHQQAWTASLMAHSLAYAGFIAVEELEVGFSRHSALRGVEGHWRVIGAQFNRVESMVFEATKPGGIVFAPALLGKCRERVAIVVGGASTVYNEIAEARALCESVDVVPEWFVVNDMLTLFEGECIAVSLHPAQKGKLDAWLATRRERGFPMPREVWAHRISDGRGGTLPGITHMTEDWGGSVGLFAAGPVAIKKLGFKKVLLCGVPMDEKVGHIISNEPWRWSGYKGFRVMWQTHHKEIEPYVRSFGGWTAERLGKPTVEWLLDQEKKAA
jgi:hypothetical protein